MPYKIGGGFKLEAYDSDTGQYTEEDKIRMRNYDDFWFKQPLTQNYEPHIPTYGIHNWEYAYKYIERFKSYLYAKNNPPEINDSKCHFLLDGIIKPNRTKWLKDRGICLPNTANFDSYENQIYIKQFQNFIIKNTDFKTLYFVDYIDEEDGLLCNAITNINGYKVTTGWKVNKDFQLKFVTLIETTGPYYEKKNQIRR